MRVRPPKKNNELKSSVTQKAAILIASGCSFAFAMTLANYWPAQEYGEIMSGFSFVSYLSFPVLFGFIPNLLRFSEKGGDIKSLLNHKPYKNFLIIYHCIILLATMLYTHDVHSIAVIMSSLLIVVGTGAGEAVLRYRRAINPVFYMRALGASLGLLIVALSAYQNWEIPTWLVYVAKFVPSFILILLLIISMTTVEISREYSTVIETTELPSIFGAAEAMLVALTVGIFQYAFVIVAHQSVAHEQFVSISIGLLASITISQRLADPHLFKIFSGEGDMSYKTQLSLFFEMVVFSLGAQLLASFLINAEFRLFDVILLSVGSSFVSLACNCHYLIFLRERSLKFSLGVFLTLFVLLMVLQALGQTLYFSICYLSLAILYYWIVAFKLACNLSRATP